MFNTIQYYNLDKEYMQIKNIWLQYGFYINAGFAVIILCLSLVNVNRVWRYNIYSNTMDASSLIHQNLFGTYVPQLNRDKIGESSLDYKVTGILFSKDKPYAMLSADDGEEKLVTVGDKLNSLKIYAIKDDYVVILNNNQLERLNLEKPKL